MLICNFLSQFRVPVRVVYSQDCWSQQYGKAWFDLYKCEWLFQGGGTVTKLASRSSHMFFPSKGKLNSYCTPAGICWHPFRKIVAGWYAYMCYCWLLAIVAVSPSWLLLDNMLDYVFDCLLLLFAKWIGLIQKQTQFLKYFFLINIDHFTELNYGAIRWIFMFAELGGAVAFGLNGWVWSMWGGGN